MIIHSGDENEILQSGRTATANGNGWRLCDKHGDYLESVFYRLVFGRPGYPDERGLVRLVLGNTRDVVPGRSLAQRPPHTPDLNRDAGTLRLTGGWGGGGRGGYGGVPSSAGGAAASGGGGGGGAAATKVSGGGGAAAAPVAAAAPAPAAAVAGGGGAVPAFGAAAPAFGAAAPAFGAAATKGSGDGGAVAAYEARIDELEAQVDFDRMDEFAMPSRARRQQSYEVEGEYDDMDEVEDARVRERWAQ